MKNSLLWPAPNVMVFEPEFKVSLTGTLRITWPPPVSGWSTQTGEPPFTLRKNVKSKALSHTTRQRVGGRFMKAYNAPDCRVPPSGVTVREV